MNNKEFENIDLNDQFLKGMFDEWENEKAPVHLKKNIMSEVLQQWAINPVEPVTRKISLENWMILALSVLAALFLVVFADSSSFIHSVKSRDISLNLDVFKQIEFYLTQIGGAVLKIPVIIYALIAGTSIIWFFDRLLIRMKRA